MKKNLRDWARLAIVVSTLSIVGIIPITAATGEAEITLLLSDPAMLSFGDVLIGSFVDRTLAIRNDGTANLTGTINDPAPPFTIVGGGGSFTARPGATRTVTVRCAPTGDFSVGTFTGTLEIVDTNDADEPTKTIALSCNGIGPEITLLPGDTGIGAGPHLTVNFGNVVVGSFADRDFTIRNNGTEGLKGTVYAPNPPFSLLKGEGIFDVSSGRTHTVTVRCAPNNRGTLTGTVEIKGTNDADEPSKTITLSCTGIGPEITLLPGDSGVNAGPHMRLDFGNVVVGQAVDRSFEIRNDGERPLRGTINAPTPTPPFSLVSGGGAFDLAPGAKRSVTARCQLTTKRSFTGTLAIQGINDVDEPAKTITLNCGEAVPDIDVTPLNVGFGNQKQGTLSGNQNITIANTGAAPLVLTNVSNASAIFRLTRPTGCRQFPCTILPGDSLVFGVQAQPNRLGPITGNLRITSNDPDEATVNVPLQVNGTLTAGKASGDLTTQDWPLNVSDLQIRQTASAIEFQVAGTGLTGVQVEFYDLQGRKIAEAASENGQLRLTTLNRDGRPLANGVYLYVLTYKGPDGLVIRDRIGKLVLQR